MERLNKMGIDKKMWPKSPPHHHLGNRTLINFHLSLRFDKKAAWKINTGDFQDVISGFHKRLKTPSQYSHVSCIFIPTPPLWDEK